MPFTFNWYAIKFAAESFITIIALWFFAALLVDKLERRHQQRKQQEARLKSFIRAHDEMVHRRMRSIR